MRPGLAWLARRANDMEQGLSVVGKSKRKEEEIMSSGTQYVRQKRWAKIKEEEEEVKKEEAPAQLRRLASFAHSGIHSQLHKAYIPADQQ